MTDRYTFRISYTIDVDVEIDRSMETPNERKTGIYEALAEVNRCFVPRGARELSIATVRHLALSKPKAAQVEEAPPTPQSATS